MSSPLSDLPDHMPMPVDADGNGPANPDDTESVICWTCLTMWPCASAPCSSTCKHVNHVTVRTEVGGCFLRCNDCGLYLP